MKLDDFDLNLLVVFQHLMVERNVTAVAEALDRSQPAISNSLKRLRELFADELFVRTSKGMEPTSHALYISESIAYALNTLEDVMNEREIFEPHLSERKFTLGLSDIGEIHLLPALMQKLNSVAPNISISTVRENFTSLQESMANGHVDIAIGMLPQLKTGFFQRRLFKQRYVCLFSRDYFADKKTFTVKDFVEANHLVISPPESGHIKVNEWIERQVRRKVRLIIPHYSAVGHILSAESDMVATVPESYAKSCKEMFGLTYTEHPLELPQIAVNIFWHAKLHRQPANKWLRTVVSELFSDLKPLEE